MLGLVRGNDDGWGSNKIVGLFIAAAVLMLIFFVNEIRRQDPMLPLKLFEKPAVVGVSVVAFAMSASIFAMFLYLTLYVQDSLGYSPLPAGMRFLPLTLLAFIVAPFAGRLTVRIQSRYLLGGGLLLVAIGLFLMSHTHPDSGWTVLLPGFIVCGAGIGMVNPVLASASISVVPPQESGMASGTNNTFRQVGIATGIAVLGAIFQSQIVSHTRAVLTTTAIGKQVLVHGGPQLERRPGRRWRARGCRVGGHADRGQAATHPRLSDRFLHHAEPPHGDRRGRSPWSVPSWAAGLVRQRDFVVPGRCAPRRPCRLSRSASRARSSASSRCSADHIDALVEAAALDRSTYQWTYTPEGLEQMTDYVHDALAKVAVRRPRGLRHHRARAPAPDGADLVVGATRYCEMAFWQWPPGAGHQRQGIPDVVDIGFTWLSGPAQRTPVNTEAKLLMMGHAFEVWEVHRVALQTDVRNKRSWAAIERIGGQLDGIMRADRPGSDDTVRTSARFSILREEWPAVQAACAPA